MGGGEGLQFYGFGRVLGHTATVVVGPPEIALCGCMALRGRLEPPLPGLGFILFGSVACDIVKQIRMKLNNY